MSGKIRQYESVEFLDGMRLCRNEGIVYQVDTSVSIEYGDGYWENYLRYENSPISDALNKFRTSITEKYCDHILDIGIGCGTFINRLSIPSYGYDINPIAVQWLKDRDIYRDPYEAIPDEVDGVTLWDVLEHIPNPDDLLDRLSPGMHFITSIPIFGDLNDIWTSKHFKKNEHYTYWTPRGLTIYMDDMGFSLIESRDDETKIGRDGIMTFVFEKRYQKVND